ncbi:MAG: hypothetical protein AB1630_04205 [bacterium]
MNGRDSLNCLWEKNKYTIGAPTLIGITKRVIGRLEDKHPVLKKLKIDNDGFDFKGLEENEKELEALYENINNVIKELISLK